MKTPSTIQTTQTAGIAALKLSIAKLSVDVSEAAILKLLEILGMPAHILENKMVSMVLRLALPVLAHEFASRLEDLEFDDGDDGELDWTNQAIKEAAEQATTAVFMQYGTEVVDVCKQFAEMFILSGVAERFMELEKTGEKKRVEEAALPGEDLNIHDLFKAPVSMSVE